MFDVLINSSIAEPKLSIETLKDWSPKIEKN